MPRWTPDPKTGKDVATIRVAVQIDRAQYAILRAYQRDSVNSAPDMRQALLTAFYIGLDELGETYDPTRKKKKGRG